MTLKKAANATRTTTTDDAQASHAQGGQEATQQADSTAIAVAAGAGSAVANAEATQPKHDENHGSGGRYQRNPDGSRTLIERTQRAAH